MTLSQKRVVGHIEVETKFIIKIKQKNNRKIGHSPDVGVGASDNSCSVCSHIRSIYDEKVSWGFA
jgi:uncharacterized UBP type Zn finger protein